MMTPSGQTLCLCMIVKNEAPVIRRCLDSVRPLIDHWIIVDTGSTDGTQDIVRKHLRDISGELVERPWRDFAHNRTEALALARPHGDYTLIIDADDAMQALDTFRMPDLDADSYAVDIDFGAIRYQRPQIVKAALGWRYEGVIHEYLACDGASTRGRLPLVMHIHQDGARRRDPDTYRKDAAILERAVAEETDSFRLSRYVFYLAQSYRDSGQGEKAVALYLRRAEMGFWEEEIYCSLLYAGRLMQASARDPGVVLALYRRASDLCPGRVEARHAESQYLRHRGEFAEGAESARPGLGLEAPSTGLFVEPWIYHYGLLDEYAVNAFWTGQYRECLDASLRIIETGMLPLDQQGRIARNARLSLEKLPRSTSSPPSAPTAVPNREASERDGDFDLIACLELDPRSIVVADVGAAFLGEEQLYQPLMDQNLGRLICFEPDDARVDGLKQHLGESGIVFSTALGDGSVHTLHIAPGGMTSVLEPDQGAYDLYTLFASSPFSPVAKSLTRTELRTSCLDDIVDVPPIDMMKIDIQGAELMVLQHGREKLSRCSVIQVEVPFVALYKNMPSFSDIDAELRLQGFMIHGFANLKRLPLNPYSPEAPLAGINQLVDLDMLYVRDLRDMSLLDATVLRKTAAIADICYQSYDLAQRCLAELVRKRLLDRDVEHRYAASRTRRSRTGYIHLTPMRESPH